MTPLPAPSQLDAAILADLAPGVTAPTYDRSAVRGAIFHVGVGGFHRAHLATYADELCAAGNLDWGIVGCGVLPGDAVMADVLDAQNGLYTLIERSADATNTQIIGSIIDYVHASPDASEAIARIADPATQIVSLTITEGGYPVDDTTGDYLPDSPNAGPKSAFGIIAAGLEARRLAAGPPLTIVSCDNILTNGAVAKAATLGEAARFGAELLAWIAVSVSFPNSMVDRITPATTDGDSEWLRIEHGIDDRWPVVTEPFRQWVIEDDFAGERLPLEDLDVIITDDVEPYEFMKLRLLNAGHSCLAYLSALMGIELVDQAMAHPLIDQYLYAFLHQEAKPVLPHVAGIDIDDYIDTLVERFRNPAIGDQIARLCLDGTAKFPKFLLPTVRAQIGADGPLELSALALAGWCQYLLGTDQHGTPIELAGDPGLDAAVSSAAASETHPEAFLDLELVFDATIRGSERFRATFADALQRIRDLGVEAAITSTLVTDDPGRHVTR